MLFTIPMWAYSWAYIQKDGETGKEYFNRRNSLERSWWGWVNNNGKMIVVAQKHMIDPVGNHGLIYREGLTFSGKQYLNETETYRERIKREFQNNLDFDCATEIKLGGEKGIVDFHHEEQTHRLKNHFSNTQNCPLCSFSFPGALNKPPLPGNMSVVYPKYDGFHDTNGIYARCLCKVG